MIENYFARLGAPEIAEAISERIGSFVFENFLQFVAADGDVVRCWYMNSGGEGPSFEINLRRVDLGWAMELIEHPPGTEHTTAKP